MKEIVLKKSEWMHGDSGSESSTSMLYSPGQKKQGMPCYCAIGVLLKDHGVPDEAMSMAAYPSQVLTRGCEIPEGLDWLLTVYDDHDGSQFNMSSAKAKAIAGFNDAHNPVDITLKRINEITEPHGIRFVYEEDR